MVIEVQTKKNRYFKIITMLNFFDENILNKRNLFYL